MKIRANILFLVAASLHSSANGFSVRSPMAINGVSLSYQVPAFPKALSAAASSDDESTIGKLADNREEPQSTMISTSTATTAAIGMLLTMTGLPASSLAAGPDWGIFEGRTGSLLHPIMMGSLLLYSIYTALLGFQWRRQRTMGDEISALKKSLPDLQGASSVQAALSEAQSAETVDSSRVSTLRAALPIEEQIKELQMERKTLSEAGPRDRHYSQGALLAFLGTAFAIEVGHTW